MGVGSGSNGSVAGNGLGTGRGTGSGGNAGTGSGNSPFPAIMIQGGSGSGGGARAAGSGTPSGKPQAEYGITIVASGSSGGGFTDFGIFKDGVSYTVYLDMADAGLQGSNWAMQYALDSHPTPGSDDPPAELHGFLSPPYAQAKVVPHFPADAARRSRGATIVVFGVIGANGNMQRLRIMQTPDPTFNQVLLGAMSQWTFKPALMNGVPVAVKCLFGVQVNSVPVE